MFQMKERLSRSVLHFNNTGLYYIHLGSERRKTITNRILSSDQSVCESASCENFLNERS